MWSCVSLQLLPCLSCLSQRIQRWGLTPLVPALGKQGQVDLCEFEATEAEHVPGWPKLHRDIPTVGGATVSKTFKGSLIQR